MNDHPRRTRLLFALLILTSLVLLTVDYQGNSSSPLRPLERAVAVLVGPFQRTVGRGTSSISGGVHFGTEQDKRIAALEDENARLKQSLATTADAANELQQLKELSGLADKWQPLPGRVIGRGSAPTDEYTLLLDIGSADGVKVESSVVTGAGLLGKIVSVRDHDSTVRLVNHPSIGIAVRVARNGESGFVLGEGEEPMRLTLDSTTADLRVGDVVVTRGSAKDRPFYPGIAVGTVTKISASPGSSYRVADVTPFATPGTLEYVGVIIGPGPDVPRRPVPAPSRGVPATIASPPAGPSPSPSPTPKPTG